MNFRNFFTEGAAGQFAHTALNLEARTTAD